jgi:ATP-dependent RNA helicase DOB1
MREVAWVIFDEVHYMRNKERGVVWEETMIMLTDKVRYAFLSATIPNATEFALWIAKLKNQPCSVVYTDYRPTPLRHFIFPSGGQGVYEVVDVKGTFKEDNFQRAIAVLNNTIPELLEGEDGAKMVKAKGKKGAKKKAGGESFDLVQMLLRKRYDPVIVFSFSKKDCEEHGKKMAKLDCTDDDEKKLIEQIFSNAIDSLSDDDKTLPQVESMLPLLRRGIGIHHGGLLPILKEVIEILFGEGLLKVLFSTETFSMGLNMPARTVVFTSVRKFDGDDFRVVSSGEYIQMSGRAGRRGLDDQGIVVCMLDEQLEPPVIKEMIKGSADPLNSSFHLGYNMLLNLLRTEQADPEYMMARSFLQFQANRNAPKLKLRVEQLTATRDAVAIADERGIAEYYHIRQQLERCRRKMQEVVTLPIHALPFLNPGRVVKVGDGTKDWGWGIIVNFQKLSKRKGQTATPSVDGSLATYIVDVLLNVSKKSISPGAKKNPELLKPAEDSDEAEFMVSLSAIRV